MGDRTWVNIQVALSDADAARKIIGEGEDEGPHGDDMFGFDIQESNYGGSTERENLREAGIPYTGEHGSGGDYGEMSFAFDGNDECETVTVEGRSFLCCDEQGEVAPEDKAIVIAYYVHEKKAKAAIAARK